jgi:hypothetical protein
MVKRLQSDCEAIALTTHHSPLTTHHSPLTTHHSPLTTHHSPLTTHHSPLTPHHSSLTTHHPTVIFISMVFVGLMNKVFNKLQTIPMYNYPNFLNLLTSFVYIPVCFAYIIPMARNGGIPPEQFEVPKRDFAIMGALDACAGIMQIFGEVLLCFSFICFVSCFASP